MNEFAPAERFVETERGKIFYYQDRSFSQRPTVVLLHGLSANHRTWDQVAWRLHEHGYNTITVELRGHGHSDKSKDKRFYELPVFREDLRQILAREAIQKPILVGYSFGGVIALDYAINYSAALAGLVLISANHANPLEYRGLGWLTLPAKTFFEFIAWTLRWQERKNYYYYRQGMSRGYWHSVWIGLNTMPLSVNLWMLLQMAKLDLRNRLHQVKVPTRIVRAPRDPFLSKREAAEMQTGIPRAEIVVTRNFSHFLASRAQDEIGQIILDFLDKHAHRDF